MHNRNDSGVTMVHSTRKSYKEKYERLKDNIANVSQERQILSDIHDAESVADLKRQELLTLLQEVAESVTDLVGILDTSDSKFRLNLKDVRKPVDGNLREMDSLLIARRTRDVVRHAADRIGIAGLRFADVVSAKEELAVGAKLLKQSLHKVHLGCIESYVVGAAPSQAEVESADTDQSKNPRLIDYEYVTDIDSDNSSSESDDEEDHSRAIVSTRSSISSTRSGKPVSASKRARGDEMVFD